MDGVDDGITRHDDDDDQHDAELPLIIMKMLKLIMMKVRTIFARVVEGQERAEPAARFFVIILLIIIIITVILCN